MRDHSGVGAPGDLRGDLGSVELYHLVVLCIGIAAQRLPVIDGNLKILPTRDKGTALQVSESRIIRRHHAGACATLDGHVADRHTPFHGKATNGVAGVLDDVAVAAGNPDLADDGQDDVLGRHPRGAPTVHLHQHRLGLELRKALRGQDVFHFAGADAERQRA